jgi:hypothetical protein
MTEPRPIGRSNTYNRPRFGWTSGSGFKPLSDVKPQRCSTVMRFFQRSAAAEVGCPNSSPLNFITSRLGVICSFPSRDIPSFFWVFPCHLLGTQALVLILLGSVLCEHFCPPDFGIAADERWKPYLVATRHGETFFWFSGGPYNK